VGQEIDFKNRVTRLDECSPMGRFISLGSFLIAIEAQKFGLLVTMVEVIH
jgi:hypothetical protein